MTNAIQRSAIHLESSQPPDPAEMEGLVRSAGLKMLGAESGGNWPYVVVAAEG